MSISAFFNQCRCGKNNFAADENQAQARSPRTGVPATDKEDPVWILVNGREIRKSEIDLEIKLLSVGFYSKPRTGRAAEVKRAAMQIAVEKVLLDQEAENKKIKLGPDELEQELKRVKARAPGEGDFERRLYNLGLAYTDFINLVHRDLVHEYLIARSLPAVEPSEEELRELYEKKKSWLTEPARAYVRDIFVMVPAEASSAERAQKKELAQEILDQINHGEDIIALALNYSDSPTRATGGRDVFVKGSLNPDFDAVVFTLAPGELSPVIELAEGFHIVLVESVTAEKTLPFGEAKALILSYLKETQRRRARMELVERLRSEAKIDYLEPLPSPDPESSAQPDESSEEFSQ